MKTPAILFLAVVIYFSSCNDVTKPAAAQVTDSVRLKQDEDRVNESMKKLDVPSQFFSAPGDQLSMIRGKKGTAIFLAPADLETEDGQPIGTKIVVELKEVTNQAELAKANVQTISNGRLLISGGAYYINMTSDGKKLKLKKDKALKVAFPKIADSTMSLFYGTRDSGRMNWQPTNDQLTSKNGYSIDTRDTTNNKSIMVYNPKSYRLMGYVGNDSTYKKDTASLRALKEQAKETLDETRLKIRLQYISQDSVSTEKLKAIIKTTRKLNENLYDITNIKALGWINCDRFAREASTNITYTIDPKDSISYARIFIVYKQINAMISNDFFNSQATGTRHLDNLPIGYQARIIAVTNKNNEQLTCKMDITITKDQHTHISWKKTTTEELNSYFDVNANWGQQ